jgi:hypothetical protein
MSIPVRTTRIIKIASPALGEMSVPSTVPWEESLPPVVCLTFGLAWPAGLFSYRAASTPPTARAPGPANPKLLKSTPEGDWVTAPQMCVRAVWRSLRSARLANCGICSVLTCSSAATAVGLRAWGASRPILSSNTNRSRSGRLPKHFCRRLTVALTESVRVCVDA